MVFHWSLIIIIIIIIPCEFFIPTLADGLSLEFDYYHYYYYHSSWIFHSNVSWWTFTGVWLLSLLLSFLVNFSLQRQLMVFHWSLIIIIIIIIPCEFFIPTLAVGLSLEFDYYHYYYYYHSSWIFHSNVSWWTFTGVWLLSLLLSFLVNFSLQRQLMDFHWSLIIIIIIIIPCEFFIPTLVDGLSLEFDYYHYYYYHSSWIFHSNVSWWTFTGVWLLSLLLSFLVNFSLQRQLMVFHWSLIIIIIIIIPCEFFIPTLAVGLSLEFDYYHYYYYYHSSWIFHSNVSWWTFTGVWLLSLLLSFLVNFSLQRQLMDFHWSLIIIIIIIIPCEFFIPTLVDGLSLEFDYYHYYYYHSLWIFYSNVSWWTFTYNSSLQGFSQYTGRF